MTDRLDFTDIANKLTTDVQSQLILYGYKHTQKDKEYNCTNLKITCVKDINNKNIFYLIPNDGIAFRNWKFTLFFDRVFFDYATDKYCIDVYFYAKNIDYYSRDITYTTLSNNLKARLQYRFCYHDDYTLYDISNEYHSGEYINSYVDVCLILLYIADDYWRAYGEYNYEIDDVFCNEISKYSKRTYWNKISKYSKTKERYLKCYKKLRIKLLRYFRKKGVAIQDDRIVICQDDGYDSYDIYVINDILFNAYGNNQPNPVYNDYPKYIQKYIQRYTRRYKDIEICSEFIICSLQWFWKSGYTSCGNFMYYRKVQ